MSEPEAKTVPVPPLMRERLVSISSETTAVENQTKRRGPAESDGRAALAVRER